MGFSDPVKQKAWDRQQGLCALCGTPLLSRAASKEFDLRELDRQAHHMEARRFGGGNEVDNCVYLCSKHHKQFGHGMFPKEWTGLKKSSGFKWNPQLRATDFPFFNGPP